MKDVMLILHFIGIAMGIGTGFAMLFLGMAASKMEKSEAGKFMQKATVLSNMGKLGLVVLIASGFGAIGDRWDLLMGDTYFLIKLGCVLFLAVLVGFIDSYAKKIRKGGDPAVYMPKIAKIGRITLPLGILIIILAVMVFH
jgi:putative copper export protein